MAGKQAEGRGKTPKHCLQTVQKEPPTSVFGKDKDMNARTDEVRSVSPKMGRLPRRLKENFTEDLPEESSHAKRIEERLRIEYQQLTAELSEARRRDTESSEKLRQLEEELRQIKYESGGEEEFAEKWKRAALEKKALQQDRDKYKTECVKLRKEVSSQIEFLKSKLTHAEDRLEEKGARTRKYAAEISRLLEHLFSQEQNLPEIARAQTLLERLQKSLATPCKGVAIEFGVQADEEKNQVAEMRGNIEEMKRGMKELEKIYESEVSRLAQEKRELELKLKSRMASQESETSALRRELERSRQENAALGVELCRMREKATMLIECLQAAKGDNNEGEGESQAEECGEPELKGAETLEDIGGENCYGSENMERDPAERSEREVKTEEDPVQSRKSAETFCKRPSYSVINPPRMTMDGTGAFGEMEEELSKKRTCELRKEIEGLDKEIGELQSSFSRAVLKD